MNAMSDNELSKVIIGCAIAEHKQLGPGIFWNLHIRNVCIMKLSKLA
jgi:hypothetical protein